MNIFMLGNGFDLHYCFPTKYINFLNTMMFLCENEDKRFETIDRIFGDPNLRQRDRDIARCYDRYKVYYPYVEIDQSALKNSVSKAKTNTWFKYFCEEFNTDVGWIDFEKEIAYVIRKLSEFFSEYDSFVEYDEDSRLTDEEKQDSIGDILRLFSLGHFDAEGECSDGEELIWSIQRDNDDEYFFLRKDILNSDDSLRKSKIISELLTSLQDFSTILSYYLHQFVEAPIPRLVRENKIRREWLFTDKNAEIITFNYTNTFEQLYDSDPKKVHHIHGVIDSDTDIVLGINADKKDELSGLNTSFLPFKKYYQRVVYQTDNSYVRLIRTVTDYKTLHNNTGEVCHLYIFGHSLNTNDKDAIKELFGIADYIDILYHSQDALSQYVENLVTIYGKHKFDQLRVSKRLNFIPDRALYDEEYAIEIGFKQNPAE